MTVSEVQHLGGVLQILGIIAIVPEVGWAIAQLGAWAKVRSHLHLWHPSKSVSVQVPVMRAIATTLDGLIVSTQPLSVDEVAVRLNNLEKGIIDLSDTIRTEVETRGKADEEVSEDLKDVLKAESRADRRRRFIYLGFAILGGLAVVVGVALQTWASSIGCS